MTVTSSKPNTNLSNSLYGDLCIDYDTIADAKEVVNFDGVHGVQLILQTQGKEQIALKHWKVNDQYKTQWILEKPTHKKIGQVVKNKDPLSVFNSRNQKAIKEQAKGVLKESELEEIIKEAGDFLSNNEKTFFPVTDDFKLAGETKKDAHMRKIALELERVDKIVLESVTKEIYIYNPKSGVYENYDLDTFKALLRKEYNFNFFKEEAKRIMSTFTMQMDENTQYIAFKNCLLDLETMEILDHNPDIFCKFQVPYNYDKNSESSFFEEKLREILCDADGDSKLRLFFQLVGYCLTNDNRHNKLFLISGSGGNGKSTLMALIRAFFGETVVSVPLQDFNKQFGLQPLIKAKVNILYDLPLKNLGDTGLIKAITGEDSITIDRKFKDPVTTKIGAKIVGTGNALPKTDDHSRAFLRRLIHIELVNTFDKPDQNLTKKLKSDTKGMEWLIYNAVQEYKKVETEGWAIQPSIDQNRDEYLKHSDPILYAAEKLFESASDQEYITRSEAYEIMTDFLERNGIEAKKSRGLYYSALEYIGGDNEDRWKGDHRSIYGIRLKT
jgi:P4 family phage/plasmid primase-like protien